jgi:hypothetical protein
MGELSLEEQASMGDDRRFLLEEEYDGETGVTLLDAETLLDDLRGYMEHGFYASGDDVHVKYIGCYVGSGVFREMILRNVDADVAPDLNDFLYYRYELHWKEGNPDSPDDIPGLGFTMRIDGRA